MKKIGDPGSPSRYIKTSGMVLMGLLAISTGCKKQHLPKALKDFKQVNLVANNGEYANLHTDPSLINAWGLTFSSNGIAWVNSEAGHVSALYDKEGVAVRAPIKIPSPGAPAGGNPTGIVFNGSADFVLSNGQPARFIFVGLDGVLSAWNGNAGDTALRIKDNSANSAYTGLALAQNNGVNTLYAANFRAGKIDVWDNTFSPLSMPFIDPMLPAKYSPFNIRALGEWLYVTYAKVGPDGDDEPGQGNGFVSIFTTDGKFVKRFASRGALNSPWGLEAAPAGFFVDDDAENDAKLGHQDNKDPLPMILVGNFGDGRINAYTGDGQFVGQLKSHGHSIVIDGLWAISFPPATATAIDPNRLYFTAGPNDEKDGLFGYLIKD
jgi:uncharacterized protein (TIGR03118 family)